MNILNFEDDIYKHHDICKALEQAHVGNHTVDWARNLEDGISKIKDLQAQGKSYDLIITDMWYPEKAGGQDAQSGEKLMAMVKENGWKIPIILCSSVRYRFPGILGTVHYSKNGDWEEELIELLKQR